MTPPGQPEFAGTAITEATGWRAMLRDKKVPLG